MYSYSRLDTFEQCPRKYKFRYIDGLKTETEGVEAFVGKRVHESLEKLYRDLKLTKLSSLEEILSFYEQEWGKNWHGGLRIARADFTPGHYFELGRQCLRDYYKHYHPFTQGKTIGLEERIEMKFPDGPRIHTLQGYIDRITWIPETEMYEIHDYKTSQTLPTQEDADDDRQLALYQLGLLQRWPDAKQFKLIWHYLAFDKELVSTRAPADLKSLQQEIVETIHQVENEMKIGRWEVRTSRLCDWCEYKPICPAWKHPVQMDELPVNEYLKDPGVVLVRTYAELEKQKADHQAAIKSVEAEQKKVADALIAFAEKEGVSAIDGPDHRIVIKSEEEFKAPRKGEDPFAWELLRTTLKNAGKLEDVSTVNAAMLKYAIKRGRWPEDLVKSIRSLITQGVTQTLSLVKK